MKTGGVDIIFYFCILNIFVSVIGYYVGLISYIFLTYLCITFLCAQIKYQITTTTAAAPETTTTTTIIIIMRYISRMIISVGLYGIGTMDTRKSCL